MAHMIATKDFSYASGGLVLKPGDKFFTVGPNAARDAVWLKAWGKARDADAVQAYSRKDEEAETVEVPVRQKRKYKRRDMTAVGWSK